MSDYDAIKTRVYAEFQIAPSASTNNLDAIIIGEKKAVVTKETAPSLVSYDAYDKTSGNEFDVKGVPAGSTLDPATVTVTLVDAKVHVATLSGANVIETTDIPSEIKLGSGATGSLVDRGDGDLDRLAALGSRDLAVGDSLEITHAEGTFITRVRQIRRAVGDRDADVSAAGANVAARVADATTVEFLSVENADADPPTAAATLVENGFGNGINADVITLTCTTGGNAATAKFTVQSTIQDFILTEVGLTGGSNDTLTVPADTASGRMAYTINVAGILSSMDPATFVVGDSIRINVKPIVTVTAAGFDVAFDPNDMTNTLAETYRISVVKGAKFGDGRFARLHVAPINGTDAGSIVDVSAAATEYPIGSKGAKIEFTGDGLFSGDVFLLEISAPEAGRDEIIVLRDPVPVFDPADNTTPINALGTDLAVKVLAPAGDVILPASDWPVLGDVAWSVDGNTLTLEPGIQIQTPAWTDNTGAQISAPVYETASVTIEHITNANTAAIQRGVISAIASIEPILGPVLPENPIAYGVYKALQESGGSPVNYIVTTGPDAADYAATRRHIEAISGAYSLVPCTTDPAVRAEMVSLTKTLCDPEVGKWKHLIVGGETPEQSVVSGGDTLEKGYVTGSVGAPTRYDHLIVPTADFVEDGVRAGDIARFNYFTLPNGTVTWTEGVVDSVLNASTIVLKTPLSSAIGSAVPADQVKVEIWRNLTTMEIAEAARDAGLAIGSMFVTRVPDLGFTAPEYGVVPAWAVAAAYAGICSSVLPHQPISNFNFSGFSGVRMGTGFFEETEMNIIASGGNMIADQVNGTGPVFVRHQLTTDMTDEKTRERSYVFNVHSISKFLSDAVKVFHGKWNNSDGFEARIATLLRDRIDFLEKQTLSLSAGPQVLGLGEDFSVSRNEVVGTRLQIRVPVELPKPFNGADIVLVLS